MASQEEVDALVGYGLLKKNEDGSLRCPSEDEKRQQARNFLECMAGEPLPEGVDPVELLEEICPGFSGQRDTLSTQLLSEAQSCLNVSDIQGAMIQALHSENVEGDGSESDEELLARMKDDSKGFADFIRRGFEKIERDCGLSE